MNFENVAEIKRDWSRVVKVKRMSLPGGSTSRLAALINYDLQKMNLPGITPAAVHYWEVTGALPIRTSKTKVMCVLDTVGANHELRDKISDIFDNKREYMSSCRKAAMKATKKKEAVAPKPKAKTKPKKKAAKSRGTSGKFIIALSELNVERLTISFVTNLEYAIEEHTLHGVRELLKKALKKADKCLPCNIHYNTIIRWRKGNLPLYRNINGLTLYSDVILKVFGISYQYYTKEHETRYPLRKVDEATNKINKVAGKALDAFCSSIDPDNTNTDTSIVKQIRGIVDAKAVDRVEEMNNELIAMRDMLNDVIKSNEETLAKYNLS